MRPAPNSPAARYRALAEVAREATSGSRHDLLRRVSVAAMQALDGASVSLSIWDPDAREVHCILNDGDLGPGEVLDPTDEVYPIAEHANLIPLFEEQQALICAVNQRDQADPYVEFLRRLGKHSCIAAPIPLEGRVWGELFVTRLPHQEEFDADDLEFAVAVAAQVGAAIATSENIDRVDVLAHTDALTGLANRRSVDEWFEIAMAMHLEHGSSVGLVACDVNGLKRVNDQHGHEAGDRLLRQLAQIMRNQSARLLPDAMVARLGGDEFAVVVQDVDTDALIAFAEEMVSEAWQALPHGVSCGVAITGDMVGAIESAGRLFRLADAAQYRAKRTGSHRPVIAGRALPVEASSPPLQMADDARHDRRLLRGHDEPRALHVLDAGLRALDQAQGEPVQHRLSLVADLVSHHLDAVGWWLSRGDEGSTEVETVQYAIYRALAGLSSDELAQEVGDRYDVKDYPATSEAMRGGSFIVHVDDPEADPGELAILDDLAAVAVVGAGGSDQAGRTWLIEVYTDPLSGSARDLGILLRVLMTVALHPSRWD